jgi:hypothetical protein
VRNSVLAPLALIAALGSTSAWSRSPSPASGPESSPAQDRFAGLQWTFARVKYEAHTLPRFRGGPYDEPWSIDYDAAELNLSRRLRTATAIQVGDPIVVTIEDPQLWKYPWLYIVEPGTMRFREAEV